MANKAHESILSFDHRHYVPCLRWKQGEYQALYRSTNSVKDQITPLIEIPEIGWDFETATQAKTIDEHLSSVGKRVKTKWGGRWCFVDLKLLDASENMADGTHPIDFVFQDLASNSCLGVPVTGVERSQTYQQAVKRVSRRDQRGICLRVTMEQAANGDFNGLIAKTLSFLGVPHEKTDFILDLGTPNFLPLDGFQKLTIAIIQRIPQLTQWRTFAIIGTSFPSSMAEITGDKGIRTREEWIMYKGLIKRLNTLGKRLPTFGDYAVNHPDPVLLDMRIIKPTASIRYTIDEGWYIIKGSNVRDFGFAQYRKLCSRLVNSQYYMGPLFSAGDTYIQNCAAGNASTGNLTTWRWVGTNHHIQKVALDVANLFGSSSKT